MAEAVLATPAKKWAREYETIYILRPNVDPDDAAKVAQRVQDVMDRMGGKIIKVDLWGKRKLAYAIDKHTRGIFVYVKFASYGDLVAELERNLRLLDPVIRYQTIVLRDGVDLAAVEVDAEETTFEAIEQTDDDEAELTTAQRLGMEEVRPRSEPAAEASGEAQAPADEAAASEAAASEAADTQETASESATSDATTEASSEEE